MSIFNLFKRKKPAPWPHKTDQERLYEAADKLHEWLKEWPVKSKGKEVVVKVAINSVICSLTLTPHLIENPSTRIDEVKQYMRSKLKKQWPDLKGK